ncbi:MAG: enoyl-CoA hydratase/isomerase family protein [Bacteroidia bacterium]|nr:enoyl-CoA hydratase/isomerase family protein [Bacteroidia bacterium]
MSSILTEKSGPVMKITLNRPDKFNSFNREMALAFQKAMDAAASDKAIRAVCITGSGKAFCAGQDLAEAMDPKGPGLKKIVEEHYNPMVSLIREIAKPVIAAVNGVAAGAGANIALCCDVVVASSSASFIQAFSSIGLVPDSGGTYFLPRLIGFGRASAQMMLADKISAEEALHAGMIYKVFPEERFASGFDELAHVLASRPTKGLALTKKLLNRSMTNDFFTQIAEEGRMQVEASESFDFNEGVQAFLEKRKPMFKGE